MFTRLLIMCLGGVLAVTSASCTKSDTQDLPAGADDAAEIRRAFESCQAAILHAEGDKALEHVSKSTLQMYQECRDHALRADAIAVKALPLGKRMLVLQIRHYIGATALKTMDGEAVFIHKIDQDWMGERGSTPRGLEGIEVTGQQATARLTVNGQWLGQVFHFVKEDGKWKIDLLAIENAREAKIQQTIRHIGTTENQFLLSILESQSGREVTDAIWEPLK